MSFFQLRRDDRAVLRKPDKRLLCNRRIMLVEDAPDQQRRYAKILKRAGAEVTLECNGLSAVTTARSTDAPFDCIVIDLVTPLLDGIEATRRLRTVGYLGTILAFTANHEEETPRIWAAAGCDAYLMKPVSPDLFVSEVARLANIACRPCS